MAPRRSIILLLATAALAAGCERGEVGRYELERAPGTLMGSGLV